MIVEQFKRDIPQAESEFPGFPQAQLLLGTRSSNSQSSLHRAKVLIIDEMGYLPLYDLDATIFFQLVSARYEHGSIILAANKSYGEWGSIFGDPIIETAILDRLLHHSTTINIRRESYRLKERRKAGLIPLPEQQQAEPTVLTQRGRNKRDQLP